MLSLLSKTGLALLRHTQIAVMWFLFRSTSLQVPAVLRLWSFAQLGVANASAIAAAFRHARDDERRTGLSAAEAHMAGRSEKWGTCGHGKKL